MSDAICRWWQQYEEDEGFCEFNPPVFMPGQDPIHSWSWQQPRTDIETGCSRGEPKTEASNLTVSDGDPVAMVDGLPVFRAKLTEEET